MVDESPEAYEVRLVTFLRQRPGERCAVAHIGTQCRWSSADGVPNAYARFLRARPHLFTFVTCNLVQLTEAAPQAAPVPAPAAAAAAGRQAPATPAALEAACVEFLARQPQRRAHVGLLGQAVMRPPGVASLKKFLLQRPRMFAVDASHAIAVHVTLLQQEQGAAQQKQQPHQQQGRVAGCAVCRIPSFVDVERQREHAEGRPHLVKVAATLPLPKLGVSLSGASELRCEPRMTAHLALTVHNDGAQVTLLRARLLRPLREVAVRGAAGGVEVPRGELNLQLEHRAQHAGVTRVMVVCSLRTADGVSFSVGHEVQLRCIDPAAAADIASLQPTSAYRRPRRAPPATSKDVVPGEQLHVRSSLIRLPSVDIPGKLRTALEGKSSGEREQLEARLAPPLCAENHAERFRELLLCEEIQQHADIRL